MRQLAKKIKRRLQIMVGALNRNGSYKEVLKETIWKCYGIN